MTNPNQEAYLSETLSAVMDGEASDMELRRLLKACENDESIKQTWTRMQLARSVMHKETAESSAAIPLNFSQGISAAIAQENIYDEVENLAQSTASEDSDNKVVALSSWRRALSGLGRVSIAASVAAGVLYVAGNLQSQDPLELESPVVADAEITIPAQDQVLVETSPAVDAQPVNMRIGHRSGLLSARTVSTGEFSPVQDHTGLPSALPRSDVPVSYLYLDDYVNYLKRRAQRQQATFPLPMGVIESHGAQQKASSPR